MTFCFIVDYASFLKRKERLADRIRHVRGIMSAASTYVAGLEEDYAAMHMLVGLSADEVDPVPERKQGKQAGQKGRRRTAAQPSQMPTPAAGGTAAAASSGKRKDVKRQGQEVDIESGHHGRDLLENAKKILLKGKY